MKTLLVKFAILVSIVVVIVLAANVWYIHTEAFIDQNDVAKFNSVPENIQIANLGASHGEYDFDWSVTNYQSFNFGLSGQTYLYDYALLRQYIPNFAHNAVVIVLVESFETTAIKEDYSDQIARYYRILKRAYMPEFNFRDYIVFKALPILSTGDNFKNSILNINPAIVLREMLHRRVTSEELAETAEKMEKSCTQVTWDGGKSLDKGQTGIEYNLNMLYKILDYCREHDLQPVLVVTPFTEQFNEAYKNDLPQYMDSINQLRKTLRQKYPDIPYFDYSHDKRFSLDSSLFFDAVHLNIYGAQKFTRIVVSDIEKAGLLSSQGIK